MLRSHIPAPLAREWMLSYGSFYGKLHYCYWMERNYTERVTIGNDLLWLTGVGVKDGMCG